MLGNRSPYSAELREQLVALVRARRRPEGLAREFELCAATINNWIKESERYGGRRADILSSTEREELRQLSQENRQLKQ